MFGARNLTAKAERVGKRAGSRAVLIGTGLAFQAFLIVFMLLYVNVPPGFNVPYGLSLHSVALFRTLWSYPTLSLSAATLSTAAALTVLALWGVYVAAALMRLRQRSADPHARELWIVIGFACLYNLELAVLMPPVLSGDVFHYALFGRMVAFYKLNPYVVRRWRPRRLGRRPALIPALWLRASGWE